MSVRRESTRLGWPLLLAATLMLGFLVTPVLTLLGALPEADVSATFGQGGIDALWVTLLAATAATLVDGLFGIPLGFWLARTDSRLRHAATAGVLVPLAIPPVVGGLLLVLWLGPAGRLGAWLDGHGLGPLNTVWGAILAQMFVAAPFIVLSARAAFAGADRRQEEAARTLGCTPLQTLARVVLPAARRGLATGLVLGWVRCLGELGATAVVAYHPYTLPVLTYVRLSGEGLATALPAGALLAAVGGLAAGAILWLDARRKKGLTPVEHQAPPRFDGDQPRALSWIGSVEPAQRGPLHVDVQLGASGFQLDARFVAPAGVTVLLGASGAGKSLTLGAVAGLVHPSTGRIDLASRTFLDTARGIAVPPEERGLGFVAQGGGLFEHLSVDDNLAFGLRHLARTERERRTAELRASFQLAPLRGARPETLSGGERHRVSLARALAAGPRGLLLDEPFAGLDAPVRHQLRNLLRQLHDRTGIPVLFVTHDWDDALNLADHVVVLERGRVVQSGPVAEVFSRPVDRQVARLVGIPNVIPVLGLERFAANQARLRTAFGEFLVEAQPAAPGDPEVWGAREVAVPPAAVGLDPAGRGAWVRSVRPAMAGWRVLVEAGPGGEVLEALLSERPPADLGSARECAVRIDGSRCHLLRPRAAP